MSIKLGLTIVTLYGNGTIFHAFLMTGALFDSLMNFSGRFFGLAMNYSKIRMFDQTGFKKRANMAKLARTVAGKGRQLSRMIVNDGPNRPQAADPGREDPAPSTTAAAASAVSDAEAPTSDRTGGPPPAPTSRRKTVARGELRRSIIFRGEGVVPDVETKA
jgi:hypothetical protein